MKPLLTICTPAIFERAESAAKLAEEISNQIAKAKLGPENVEHLVLFDNRSMTVGEKRQRLFDSARGEYVAFVDDDDWILPGYVASVYNAAMKSGADVVTFKQACFFNGHKGIIDFRIGNPDDYFVPDIEVRRGPWHICAWRKELVVTCRFRSCNYGEDYAWALQARALIRRGAHIDKVLHEYHHDDAKTAAPAPVD